MSRAARRSRILAGMRLRALHTKDLRRAHPDDSQLLGYLHGTEAQELDRWGWRGYAAFNPGSHFWKAAR